MHPTVFELRELISTATAKPIEIVDTPTDRMAKDAVCIWAWRVDEDRSIRHVQADPRQTPTVPSLRVSYLVFAPDLETLELVRTAAFQSPVVGNGGQRILIQHDPLEAALLLSLFLAANVKPLPCLSFVLNASSV